MSQSNIPVTSGSGNTVDTWTTANAQKRQGIVIGDPSVDANVASVVTADPGPSSTAPGVVVRLAGSAQVQLAGATGTLGVYITGTAGTLIIKPDPAGTFFTNNASTAGIFTASGSASGVSVSGNTIISPSSAYSFKIVSYSIQTTGAVSLTTKFTNGNGSSPTEFWRPLVTASGVTGAQGANLTQAAPSYIFATGTNTTLSLVLDSASLVHYSVSYVKETA